LGIHKVGQQEPAGHLKHPEGSFAFSRHRVLASRLG
jgi:hypothetical protein